MPRPLTHDRRRAANVLGAFALALTDKIEVAIREVGDCSDMTSAAIIQIGFEPGMSIERLRGCLGLSHSATVRLIDGIERDGLVARSRNPAVDSRVAVLALTSAGEALMKKTLAARATVTEPILARLSASEVTTLMAILDKALPHVVVPGADEDIVCRLCDIGVCPQDACPVCPEN